MTYAPADLLAVREFLLSSTGLSGDAVGIVGDPEHASTGGYHEGNDDLARVGRLNTDYSKRESGRDRPGTNGASGIDIGRWADGDAGISWLAFNYELAAACRRGDPRTEAVREVIYTPDGSTVRRFDRLGLRTSGDSSHLFHTHISFFRDSEGRRAQPDNVLGLLRALIEGDDMGFMDDPSAAALAWQGDAVAFGKPTIADGPQKGLPVWLVAAVQRLESAAAADAARDAAAKVAIDALAKALAAAGGSVDAAAILARIDAVAAAESAAVAQLHAELVSARQESAQLRERLAAALDPAP